MALTRLVIDGFGQLEHNNVAYPRDGRVEAQCKLDPTDFEEVPAENGMLLAVDNINKVVKFATDASLPIGINYTAEHMYDERKPGLKNFKLERGEFLPRMGYLSVGELWTTNCVCYDDTEFADDDALLEAVKDKATLSATPVYAGASNIGAMKLTKTEPTFGPVLKVVEKTTMPDGQFAVKVQVIKA